MAYLTQYEYYTNESNHGSYQYISLKDIVNNFMAMHTGNHSLINNESRYKIIFHAKNAIKELNYDALKEVKVLELEIPDNLKLVLPHDFVNWIRISIYKDNYLRPLTENNQVNSAKAYLQANDGAILFDESGNILEPDMSKLDRERITGVIKTPYLNDNSPYNGALGYYYEGAWYFEYSIGARFGLNTETANNAPTFRIDKKLGVINFSSDMSGEICVIEYISDGMEGGDDSLISVNKLFEQYIYAFIRYEILNNKLGVQEYVVNRARRDKTALLRNARIRMSNIHPGKLLMSLRGQNKWLK